MKKFLCILMAITMSCALITGCSGGSPQGSQPESSAPQSAAPAPAEDGQKVLGLFMSLSETNWQIMDNMLREKFEALGYTYDSVSAENDPIKQIEQIENGVVQGYDLFVIIPVTGEAVADACQAAMDSGVYVYSFINDTISRNVYRTVDPQYAGALLVQYSVEEWALKHFPDAADGSINAVIMGCGSDSNTLALNEAAQEKIKEYPQINLVDVRDVEASAIAGQAATENILTMNPNIEINLWIATSSAQAVGMNSALMAENSGVRNLSDVALCVNALDEAFAGLMRASVNNESVVRLSAANGSDLDLNVSEIVEECDRLLKGESVEAFSPCNVDLVTPDNLSDFGY